MYGIARVLLCGGYEFVRENSVLGRGDRATHPIVDFPLSVHQTICCSFRDYLPILRQKWLSQRCTVSMSRDEDRLIDTIALVRCQISLANRHSSKRDFVLLSIHFLGYGKVAMPIKSVFEFCHARKWPDLDPDQVYRIVAVTVTEWGQLTPKEVCSKSVQANQYSQHVVKWLCTAPSLSPCENSQLTKLAIIESIIHGP